MNVLFLVPDIHERQTGGNVFNRRIIEGLRSKTAVRAVPWSPDEMPVADLVTGADVIVADSLLAHRPDALRAVQDGAPAASLVLLVHYLHCIDPRSPDAETAANERETLSVVDAAIATSRFVRRAVVDEGLARDRVEVVRPGLDDRYRDPMPLRLGRGVPRLLTVANLLPEKGLRPFIDVLRGLRDGPWTWTLVGDASLDPAYAAGVFRQIRTAGLAHRVTWTGPVSPDALRGQYDRADLFVLPSRFETCSLSTREAMARGLPVVGFRVGGLPENFGDAGAGSLVPPGDEGALRAALRSLRSDPMARERRGVAAWRRSRAFPSWDEAAGRFREVLDVLHGQRQEPSAPG